MKKFLQQPLESNGFTGYESHYHAGPNRPKLLIYFGDTLVHEEIVPENMRAKAWGLWMVNRFHNFVKAHRKVET
jgi:hypothetical protein